MSNHQQLQPSKKWFRQVKPHWLIISLGVFIFSVEFFIMYMLGFVVNLSPTADMFIDSLTLIIVLSPILFLLYHELNKRIQVEDRLQRERDKFKAIFEGTGDGMRIIDTEFNIIMSNEKMAELIKIPVEKQIGMKCYECLSGEFCHTPSCSLKRILNGVPIVEEEILRTTPRGELWMHHIATPLRGEGGKVEAVIEAFRDVSQRRKAEEALKESNKKLQEALDELKRMQAQLVQQEKLASIGHLAAGIAHEMNNPVGFVSSNFRNLRDYIEDFKTLLEEYRQFLQRLEEKKEIDEAEIKKIRQTEAEIDLEFILEDLAGLFNDTEEGLKRLTEIIQNLREFSRVDQVGDFTEYNINEGIKSTLVITKNEYKYHTEVKTELGNIPPIYCHPGQINEVFMNIIVNAAQAIKSQNRNDKGAIFIKTYSDDKYIYCAISDDGPGIPEEIRGKIFDPFFTTKEVGKGTGLGLSICYDIIVNKHKGNIWVESEVGKGTTFFIKLPRERPEEVSVEAQ